MSEVSTGGDVGGEADGGSEPSQRTARNQASGEVPEPSADRGTALGASLVTGAIVGALQSLLAISFGGLIFSGALSQHAGPGIGVALFAGMAVLIVVALRSAIPTAVGSVQDVTAAVLVVVTAGIAANLGAEHPGLFGTVLVAIAFSTFLTGVLLWTLGTLGLGSLGRFLPFPVIGGFLAGTGWLLVTGGISLLGGGDAPLGDPALWSDPSFLVHIAPGLALGLVLLIGIRRGAATTFIPVACLAAIGLFYLVVLLGPGFTAAEDRGWLLGPFPAGALWPPDLALVTAIEPGAIAGELGGIVTVAVLSAVALLLTVSGVELTTQHEADLDHELQVAGGANLLAAVGGGLPGFHALSLTDLTHRAGARGRVTGLVAAAVVGVTLLLSGNLVALVPRPVVGGLLVFLGLTFLVEWLVDGWSRMAWTDYAIVVLIVGVIATVGFLPGVVVGIVATLMLFIVTYSRTDVVRHAIRGDAYPSHVERCPADQDQLRELAPSITILELQGFLFFGTAHRLFERIGARLRERDEPLTHIVLDFRHVTGLDSSTVLSFQKAAQLALRHQATIVLSGMRERVASQVVRAELARSDAVRIERDLDQAYQWCEDQLLAYEAGGLPASPTALRDRLIDELGSEERADHLLGHLEYVRVPAGSVIIEQGSRSGVLYLVESGTVTVSLVDTSGATRRLRTMMAGTVIGEIGLYLAGARSATAVADTDCVLRSLSVEQLARLEREDPVIATALHRLLARHLADRLASTLRTIEALAT